MDVVSWLNSVLPVARRANLSLFVRLGNWKYILHKCPGTFVWLGESVGNGAMRFGMGPSLGCLTFAPLHVLVPDDLLPEGCGRVVDSQWWSKIRMCARQMPCL